MAAAEVRKLEVFVSYSRDSPEHCAWVLRMIEAVRGVVSLRDPDVELRVFFDEHEDPPPADWQQRIQEKLEAADRVLCVCTPEYAAAMANAVTGPARRGATYEARLIREEVYAGKGAERFIAVLGEGVSREDVPKDLGGVAAGSFVMPEQIWPLVQCLVAPTSRRRLIDAFEAMADSREAFASWVSRWVPGFASYAVAQRGRTIIWAADRVLRLEPEDQQTLLADLAWRAPDHRASLQQVATALGIDPSWDAPPQLNDGPPAHDPAADATTVAAYLHAAGEAYDRVRLVEELENWRVPLDLESLFVPLHAWLDRRPVVPRVNCGDEAELELDADWRQAGVPLLRVFHPQTLATPPRGVVVLGDPGSGKTTQLLGMLLRIARDGAEHEAIGLPKGTVPVFLPLSSLRPGVSLPQHLQAEAGSLLGDACPPDFAQAILRHDSVLLLCDGLDEVADPAARAEVSRWLAQALDTHRQCRMIATSRYAGYTQAARLPAQFLEMNLHGLTMEAVQPFVERFFVNVATHLLPAGSAQRRAAKAAATADAKAFLAELRSSRRSPRVAELTSNPLLLTMVCLVHRHDGKLPKNRTALYERVCRYLVKRWVAADGEAEPELAALRTELSKRSRRDVAGALLELLEPLAAWMHRSEQRQVGADALAQQLRPQLEAVAPGISAEGALRSVRDQSGLLVGLERRALRLPAPGLPGAPGRQGPARAGPAGSRRAPRACRALRAGVVAGGHAAAAGGRRRGVRAVHAAPGGSGGLRAGGEVARDGAVLERGRGRGTGAVGGAAAVGWGGLGAAGSRRARAAGGACARGVERDGLGGASVQGGA